MSEPKPLVDWPLHQPATVVTISPTGAFAARLGQLGIRSGMSVTPLMQTPGKGIVLGAGELRIALDRASAGRIHVTEQAPA